MLTYVINTSENRTFDSSMLFELAAYNKIRWMQCPLDEVKKCADEISEKQNVLGADRFRIAVIVDFYNFDRIRIPYGRRGFAFDGGVDVSIYMPYIEVFLLDNLVAHLEKKDICAADFEVYYVHNEKSERYEIFENAKYQVAEILSGGNLTREADPLPALSDEEIAEKAKKAKKAKSADSTEETDVASEKREKTEAEKELEEDEKFDRNYYSTFRLYCTKTLTLEFDLDNYAYGRQDMTFSEFWDACRRRWSYRTEIRRHYYLTSYGGGASRAALDTLSLSLYLIRIYEREETLEEEGELEISHLDANLLREVLETAWCRVNSAKAIAKRNTMEYYSLEQTPADRSYLDAAPEVPLSTAIARERALLPKTITRSTLSAEGLYREIDALTTRKSGELQQKNREKFDEIMEGYLRKRDETREADIEEEFLALKASGTLKTTDRCPSKEEYNVRLEEKQKAISSIFERALAAEYIEVDYSEEKEKADRAITDYRNAKACLGFHIIGDILLLLLTVGAILLPYGVLQLASFAVATLPAYILALNAIALFGGLFVLSLLLQVIPQTRKLKAAKKQLLRSYVNCCATEMYSFSALSRRYEKDLVDIEHKRYEMRQLKRIYNANLEKSVNASVHYEMLEKLEDCISGILNNLDVIPVMEQIDTIEDQFDINKPFHAKENKIYQIFSLEAIETMFPRKGSDWQ